MNRRTLIVLATVVLGGASPLPAQTSIKPATAAKPSVPAPAGIVNLNTATALEIATLPGIGPKTAELIVQFRQKNGAFKKIEEIMNVRGVGEKSFLKLKNLITVSAARPEN